MTIITLPRASNSVDAVQEMNDFAARQLCDEGHRHAAIVMTKRAIYLQPNSRELWANLSAYFWHEHETKEALAAVERALSLDPQYYLSYANRGLILQDMGDLDAAEEDFTHAMELNPEHKGAQWCRSLLRLSRGDYKNGFADYEARRRVREVKGKKIYPDAFPSPFWQGEPLEGKSIYVCSEQGLGDTILFSRYLPLLAKKAKKVYFTTNLSLTVLMWDYREHIEFIPEGLDIPEDTDYSVMMASLPYYLGTISAETIPNDSGLILKRAKVQARIGAAKIPPPADANGFKVGICWTGNPEQDRNKERSIPFEQILELASYPGIWLYGLQPGNVDIQKNGAERLVMDLGSQLKDRGLVVFADALRQMDLVVTCCTVTAHLCGALGIPAYVILCAEPYWVWGLKGTESPWWPSLILFRQKELWKWNEVIGEIREAVFRSAEAHRKLLTARSNING